MPPTSLGLHLSEHVRQSEQILLKISWESSIMVASDILVTFMFLMVGLFFVPKLLQKAKIPAPVTEFFLGVAVVLLIPAFVTQEMTSIVTVFATIGVITIFMFAGTEVDFHFLQRNRKRIFLSVAAHVVLIAILALLLLWLDLSGRLDALPGASAISLVAALLISLVLITPSSGFIVSMLNTSKVSTRHKAHHTARAISVEIVAILLLIVLLQLGQPINIFFVFIALAAIVMGLPWLINLAYSKILSKLVNVEFSFFFVVALISAYATELLGLHFIIGAFVAGLVIHNFIELLVQDTRLTHKRADRLVHGMNFLATLFVPFYFFSVGMQFQSAYFRPAIIIPALVLFVVVTCLRLGIISWFQAMYSKRFKHELRGATALLPTLMVGFIIADIIHQSGYISDSLFAVLIWYAVLTSLTPILGQYHLERAVIRTAENIASARRNSRISDRSSERSKKRS